MSGDDWALQPYVVSLIPFDVFIINHFPAIIIAVRLHRHSCRCGLQHCADSYPHHDRDHRVHLHEAVVPSEEADDQRFVHRGRKRSRPMPPGHAPSLGNHVRFFHCSCPFSCSFSSSFFGSLLS